MGNKRKAVAIILGVVAFAVAVVSGAFLTLFKPSAVADVPVTNAATTIPTGATGYTFSGLSVGCNSSWAATLTANHVYFVEIAGQASPSGNYGTYSAQYKQGGNGAICYGFVKPTSTTSYTAKVGWGSATTAVGVTYSSGGYSSFSCINFAIPQTTLGVSQKDKEGVSGGGGSASAVAYSGELAPGGNAGYDFGMPGGYAHIGNGVMDKINKYYTDGYARIDRYPNQLQNNATNTAATNYFGSGKSGATGVSLGGAGGGGYYGGAGGFVASRMFTNITASGYSQVIDMGGDGRFGGSGGSSSPNLYYVGATHTGTGYVKIVDLTPTAPTSTAVNVGSTATITTSSYGTDGSPDPRSIMYWQFSTDGGNTWSLTKPTRTAVGSQTVLWRYIIGNGSKVDAVGQVVGGTANCVVATGSVTLTVNNAPGTVAAPTLTSNPVYTGNAIKVVTAAGKSSGTFTFATKETDENDESEREEH